MKRLRKWVVALLGRTPAEVELAAQAATLALSDAVGATPEQGLIKLLPGLTVLGIGWVGQRKLASNVEDLATELRRLRVDLDRVPEIALRVLREGAMIPEKERRQRLANAVANFAKTAPEPSGHVTTESAAPWPENEEVMREACLRAVAELATLEVDILSMVIELFNSSAPSPPGLPAKTFTGDMVWDVLVGRRPLMSREAFLAGLKHVAALGLLDETDVYGGGRAYVPNNLTHRFLWMIRQPDPQSS
jgi:hypothetical protein